MKTKTKKEYTIDLLTVKVFESREKMGKQAAKETSDKIKELLANQKYVNMIFAAAPSQNEFLSSLAHYEEIDWNRVNAFHMDEYIGLPENHPQLFGNFLRERIFDKVAFHKVYYLNENEEDPNAAIQRYVKLLHQYPPDIVCMGVGENTHIAFNDPDDADFNDPFIVKTVKLDEVSRQQQVHDGCFANIKEVPVLAITLTIPILLSAKYIYCMVPGSNKSEAIYHTLHEEIDKNHPATSLRKHSHAILYLDNESAKMLNGED